MENIFQICQLLNSFFQFLLIILQASANPTSRLDYGSVKAQKRNFQSQPIKLLESFVLSNDCCSVKCPLMILKRESNRSPLSAFNAYPGSPKAALQSGSGGQHRRNDPIRDWWSPHTQKKRRQPGPGRACVPI